MKKEVFTLLALFIIIQIIGCGKVKAAEIGDKVVKQAPIVIKTPDGNYDQPNFDDYRSCVRRYDSCVASCSYDKDCLAKCPNCPVLVNEDMLVQGVNDTDYKGPVSTAVNSTNIIRLTNEIHNVIDNNLGDVVAKNENNIKIIATNNGTSGGGVRKPCNTNKYGMGCNERGPCCTVISNRQRQKHCGDRCQAPVMYARKVVQCSNDNDLNSCGHVVEYKPYHPRRNPSVQRNRCNYQSAWPFINCPNKRNDNGCSPECLQLAYGYILQHGVPSECVSCFETMNGTPMSAIPMGYVPKDLPGDMYEYTQGNGWTLEDQKWG